MTPQSEDCIQKQSFRCDRATSRQTHEITWPANYTSTCSAFRIPGYAIRPIWVHLKKLALRRCLPSIVDNFGPTEKLWRSLLNDILKAGLVTPQGHMIEPQTKILSVYFKVIHGVAIPSYLETEITKIIAKQGQYRLRWTVLPQDCLGFQHIVQAHVHYFCREQSFRHYFSLLNNIN